MPTAGGVAAKYGDRYEGRWTLLQLLRVLREEAEWIRVEVPGVDEAEFAVGLMDSVEFHQVKRQRAEGAWTITALADVLRGFLGRLADSTASCTFVSTELAKKLDELSDRARRAESAVEFEQDVVRSKNLVHAAAQLTEVLALDGLPEVWSYVQRIAVDSVSEPQLMRLLRSECRQLVAASPGQVLSVLGDLLEDSVSKTLHAHEVWQHIKSQGWRRAELGRDESTLAAIDRQNRRFGRRLNDLTIGERFFPPLEAATVLEMLLDPEGPKAVLISGHGGAGKSGVIRAVFDQLSAEGWPLLALRADWLPLSQTSAQLVADLGIPASPAIVLAALPSSKQRLLILDQLDAVSAASGRRTGLVVALEDLFDELADVDDVRILMACRKFDLQSDRRLRRLAAGPRLGSETVQVFPWDESRVQATLESLGLPIPRQALIKLLETPLHLALYVEVATQRPDMASHLVSVTGLFAAYWEFKHQQVEETLDRPPRWLEVLEAVSDSIDRERALWVPEDLVDRHRPDARAMISAGVLRRDEGRISFFHEAFFDYVFGRLFVQRGGTLVEYLMSRDQDLFRRSQVRQVLDYLRLQRPERFRSELTRLLGSSQIRFHLKAIAVDLLGQISDPRPDEWNVLAALVSTGPPGVRRRLLSLVRGSALWFALAVTAGFIARWLESTDPEQQDRVTEILSTQQRQRPDLVVQLLRQHAGRDEHWVGRLCFIVQSADLALDRGFFELVLELLDQGILDGLKGGMAVNSDFWDLGHGLAEKRPAWAAELCVHHLNRQAERARSVGESNPFSAELGLLPDSHLGPQILLAAAEGAPEALASGLVPWMLDVSRENPADDGYHDSIWRYRSEGPLFGMAEAVRGATERALRAWAGAPSPELEPLLAEIRAVESATPDHLLLAAYAGASPAMADDAVAALLADDARRLNLGAATAAVITNASPRCSERLFNELEVRVLGHRSAYERENPLRGIWGWSQFQLLRAFARGRLTEPGRRRLEQLERKFPPTADTVEAAGVYGGFIEPPIPPEAVRHMDDEDWLRAMRKHQGPRLFDVEHPLKGGAEELAQLFGEQFKDDPDRFVHMAARLPGGLHASYYEAALFGSSEVADRPLGDPLWEVCRRYGDRPEPALQMNLCRIVERAASSGVPADILDIVTRIATQAPDPDHDVWQDQDSYSGPPGFGGRIDMAAINSTRGRAALALGAVLRSTPTLATRLEDVLNRVVSDPVYAVRAAAAHVVLALVGMDDERAVALFERLVEGAPDELFASHAVVNSLDHLLRRRPDVVLPFVRRMVRSSVDQVAQHGGRLAAIAWLLEIEPTKAWLDAGSAARAGGATVIAGQIRYANFHERCAPLLRAAFSDPADSVREAATQAFWDLDSDELERLEDVCMDFLSSASRAQHLGHLLHGLERSRALLPRVVEAVATAFLDEAGDRVTDIRFAEAAQAETVARLIVRTYSATTDRGDQGRYLDLLDKLLERGASGVEKSLADFER